MIGGAEEKIWQKKRMVAIYSSRVVVSSNRLGFGESSPGLAHRLRPP
jgi:hypothetical protein